MPCVCLQRSADIQQECILPCVVRDVVFVQHRCGPDVGAVYFRRGGEMITAGDAFGFSLGTALMALVIRLCGDKDDDRHLVLFFASFSLFSLGIFVWEML